MRGVLKALGIKDRVVWMANSFEGLPKPNANEYPDDRGNRLHTMDVLSISLETVKGTFARYGLLDEQVRFLRGWFRDTFRTHQSKNWQCSDLMEICTSQRWTLFTTCMIEFPSVAS